jgi:hypothetical protein
VGLSRLSRRELMPGPANRAWSALLRTASRMVPPAILADSSPYDRAMRVLHDALKDDAAFQADASREKRIEFRPFWSWAVLTDMVSHAVVSGQSGQHALVATFHVRLDRCVRPELAPFNVLAGIP